MAKKKKTYSKGVKGIVERLEEAVFKGIIGFACIAIGYVLLYSNGASESIIDTYKSMDNRVSDSKSNFLKKVQTVTSTENGFYSLSVQTSDMTKAEGSEQMPLTPYGEKNAWSKSYWEEQLSRYQVNAQGDVIDSQIDSDYFTDTGFKILTVPGQEDGRGFIYEKQGASINVWQTFKPSDSTMSGAGCGFFAISAIASNEFGRLCTVKDMLTALGQGLKVSRGVYLPDPAYNLQHTVNSDNYNSLICDNKTIELTLAGLNQMYGLNKQISVTGDLVDSSSGNSKMPTSCVDKLRNGSAVYLIHVKESNGGSDMLRSGSQHWTALMGIVTNSDGVECIITLCNGSRGLLVPLTEFTQKNLNHIYEVVIE